MESQSCGTGRTARCNSQTLGIVYIFFNTNALKYQVTYVLFKRGFDLFRHDFKDGVCPKQGCGNVKTGSEQCDESQYDIGPPCTVLVNGRHDGGQYEKPHTGTQCALSV